MPIKVTIEHFRNFLNKTHEELDALAMMGKETVLNDTIKEKISQLGAHCSQVQRYLHVDNVAIEPEVLKEYLGKVRTDIEKLRKNGMLAQFLGHFQQEFWSVIKKIETTVDAIDRRKVVKIEHAEPR